MKSIPGQAPYTVNNPHYQSLIVNTGSSIPIVRLDWLIATIAQSEAGGRYYEAARIKRRGNKGESAEETFLKSMGAFRDVTLSLNTDNRSLVQSSVTARRRVIEYMSTLGVRPNNGAAIVWITRDLGYLEEKDPRKNFVLNLGLRDYKYTASEIIALKADGHPKFALFDGEGNLQDSAPGNVVADNTLPLNPSLLTDPKTLGPFSGHALLQASISCLSCHGVEKGYRSFKNIANTRNLVPLIDRRKFEGQPTKPLFRSRTDTTEATFLDSKGLTVEQGYSGLVKLANEYQYSLLSPEKCLRELGINVPQGVSPTDYFNRVVPPFVPQGGVPPIENPLIGFIREGTPILRSDWEEIFPDVVIRVRMIQ